jgi:hypothetical protein
MYDLLDEESNESSPNMIKFQLQNEEKVIKNKLGRKRKEEINENGIKYPRAHTKYKKDNMRSKIMTHFSKFIISFLNDYGKNFFPNQKNDFFKKVDNKLRNKVNINSINNMMQKTLNEFCELKVSTKYQNYENINFNSLNILSNYFEPNFFEKKISEFYKDFYLSKDIEKLKTVYGISNKTKNFECLLNKFNDDIKYRNLLEKIGNKLLEFANIINDDTSDDEILSSFYSMINPVNEEEISFNYYDCCDSVEPTNISNQ